MGLLSMKDLSIAVASSRDTLSELLDDWLIAACSDPGGDGPCLLAAQEHFAAGGSRLRARICYDAGARLGLAVKEASLAAVVCELLHNASLIQDDLLDRTPTRRRAPSVWAKYGDTIAVCTGDLMLSAAYGLLADLSSTATIAEALRLVHLRTSQVIRGQAAECSRSNEPEETVYFYEQQAKGKSASLLSLALELPLLLSGHLEDLPTAHAAASSFAVAYQIADDLNDYAQDRQEGSSNLLLLLQQGDGLTFHQAGRKAIELATSRLDDAEAQAALLPKGCADTLLQYSGRLRHSITGSQTLTPVRSGD